MTSHAATPYQPRRWEPQWEVWEVFGMYARARVRGNANVPGNTPQTSHTSHESHSTLVGLAGRERPQAASLGR